MDALPSTRFFSRARRSESERGYALISALVLAVLYFALMALLLLDSQRELAEARRFRARMVAETLAENGAELAALQIVTRSSADVTEDSAQGSLHGTMTKNPIDGSFTLTGEGTSGGITESKARVIVKGRVIDGNNVRIQYTQHLY